MMGSTSTSDLYGTEDHEAATHTGLTYGRFIFADPGFGNPGLEDAIPLGLTSLEVRNSTREHLRPIR